PFRDRGGELLVGASRLAPDIDVIGDDIGGVTCRLAVPAAEYPGIARPVAVLPDHVAEPALALSLHQCQGGRKHRRDAAFRRPPRMRGLAEDLGFPIDLAHRAGDELGSEPAVDVEAHTGTAEILRIELAGTMETALLAHGEQQGDRRVR